jgi:hypothetical protein
MGSPSFLRNFGESTASSQKERDVTENGPFEKLISIDAKKNAMDYSKASLFFILHSSILLFCSGGRIPMENIGISLSHFTKGFAQLYFQSSWYYKKRKRPDKPGISFFVAGAGLEPATFGL